MSGLEWYGFCDVALALSARRPQALADFASVYGAFRTVAAAGCPSLAPTSRLNCYLDTDSTGRGRVDLDEVSYPLDDPDPSSAYALSLIFDRVAARSLSHLFVHAAAVALDGRALLLAGPSGHGKSTLAQALADRGATVLCDDVAPLEITSGLVSNFPLRCRERPGRSAAPVAGVFVLQSLPTDRSVRLAVDRVPAEWGREPPWGKQTPVTVCQAQGHWELIAPDAPPGMSAAIAEFCGKAGVVILRDLSLAAAEFGQTPQLTPLTPPSALPQLLGHLFGRNGRALTEVGWQLASALPQATFWQLRPGRPELTAEAVLAALETLPR